MENFWKFLAGMAFFLIGMYFLEQGLQALAGHSFKKFLRKQTTTPFRGVLAGIGVTAILQSSTLVSLMMIAFVGAGVLALRNAIGVIFGANLGTTATDWLIAWLGFDLKLDTIALPLIALGGLTFVFFNTSERTGNIGRFVLGFGLLFLGLGLMKEPVAEFSEQYDLRTYRAFHPYLFYPIGIVFATLLNSTTVVMITAMSTVSAGVLPIDAACALVIGSDLGKTAPAILGSLRGMQVQKQLAASHTIFNLFNNLIALILLYPLIYLIRDLIGMGPVFTLVMFHSVINLIGILAITPWINRIAGFVKRRFDSGNSITQYIPTVPTAVPEIAIEALHQEILHLARKVAALNVEGLRIHEKDLPVTSGSNDFDSGSYGDHYDVVKQLQGETVKYYVRIQSETLTQAESDALQRHSLALRHLLKSAKRLKDVTHNIREFESSGNDDLHQLFKTLRKDLIHLYTGFHTLLDHTTSQQTAEQLSALVKENRRNYDGIITKAYGLTQKGRLDEIEIATLQNATHEIYSANKALFEAMAYVLLTAEEELAFSRMPELNN